MVLMAFANIAIAKVNISIQQLMGTWKVINPTYNDMIETFDFTKTSICWGITCCKLQKTSAIKHKK